MSKKHVTNFRGDMFYTPDGKIKIKDEPETPIEEDFGDHNNFDFEIDDNTMRRSMSLNDIASLHQNVKMEYMVREYNSGSHDGNENSYRELRPRQQSVELSKTKFVSMAEAIYHFQRDTPSRFHSTRPQVFRSTGVTNRSRLTRPQSPMLRCKDRSRPQHHISQKEKEELELEEIKKHKIKANPIPKSVIEGTVHLPEVPKKAITIPEPFNLTEVHKKLTETTNEVQKFKARPAPKQIFEKPDIPVKQTVHVTKPVSPKFHYKKPDFKDQVTHDDKPSKQNKVEKMNIRHGPVRPEPFSFEKRDEELKKRKEARIKQQIELERKQAELFKAQPLPAAVRKHMNSAMAKAGSSSTSSENKENHIKFEAKPPTVLYQKPFKPILNSVQISKVAPFQLTTEKRAAEREKFDRLLKEKEEEQERMRQLREKEQQESEMRAQAELRQKLIHHAKPAPSAAPFIPQKSDIPITVPETPKFVRRQK